MIGKFISETYNKVKSKADEVRLHVSVQAIKAKEVFGLVNPTTQEQLEILLNYELQQIDTAETLIGTYKKWIYNIIQSEKSDCIRYYKTVNKINEKNNPNESRHLFMNNVCDKNATIQIKRESETTSSSSNSNCVNWQKDNDNHREENIVQGDHGLVTARGIHNQIESQGVVNKERETIAMNINHDTESNLLSDTTNSEQEKHKKMGSSSEEETSLLEDLFVVKNKQKFSIKPIPSEDKINDDIIMHNINHDQYGYNFKEFFLKSNILEKSISLIIEKREIRLSLVGPIEKDDVENPRTTILTMFKHCLIGNEKLHKDILFIILTTDKLFDNHRELFLELLGILKLDYLDVYLTNVRKIISSEVVCLKSKIQTYNYPRFHLTKLFDFNDFTPKTSMSSIDLEKETKVLNSSLTLENMYHQQLNGENERKGDKTEELQSGEASGGENVDTLGRENVEISGDTAHQAEDYCPRRSEEELFNEDDEGNSGKGIEPVREDIQVNPLLSSEKELIEYNRMQQIKILASTKLLELHKTVSIILLLSAKNREKRKNEIKIKLEELKKIMDVCKKDCEVTLNDAEDSKTHLENVYVKELDVKTSNINKTQERINQMKVCIDELVKKKNELYNEYQSICREINIKNKELSGAMSALSLCKKELNETEGNYLNKLSNTSKAKHMHQERKLYISNLGILSDEILREYESSSFISTEEFVSKSKKIKKPLKQVITNHLSYLKDKLFLLNILLNFYVQKVKYILGKNAPSNDSSVWDQTGEKNHLCDVFSSDKDAEEEETTHHETEKNSKLKHIPFEIPTQYDQQERENKIKLMKYKKCYFKVIEQVSKVWITIQEFYDLNQEHMEEDQNDMQHSVHSIYEQISEMYNYSKRFIKENSPLISSIS
ncbi:conserved Plasmodium protein, unknown function [Plasmodium ovale]|uniref:Uncharacterized protein n=1 Tax=Plasmodium ovale TaxID=36330 RepID=A0A1D3TGG3_PLAOA|nr:conserved Plasmodium protein, unknown function [Plasmodium ovale]